MNIIYCILLSKDLNIGTAVKVFWQHFAEQIFCKIIQHCLEVFLLHVYIDLYCTALTVKGEKMIKMIDKDDLNYIASLLSLAYAYAFQLMFSFENCFLTL